MSCNCNNDCNCSEPIKVCTQTNIPQVDNSAIECSKCGFISGKCVILTEAIAYLGIPENSSLDDVINALLLSLINTRDRVSILEGYH